MYERKKLKRLRIYTTEKDTFDGLPFYEWVAQKAYRQGLAGCSVLRGIGGFCRTTPLMNAGGLRINQPVILEFIDQKDVLEDFVETILAVYPSGTYTFEDVSVGLYGKKNNV